MYKKILVPLDGSNRAEAILPHVEEMARCTGAKIIFFQVVEPAPVLVGPHDALPIMYEEDEVEQRQRDVDAYLAGREEAFRAKGFETDRRVAYGPVVESIIKQAAELDVDLIAMASHGRSGLPRVFYGSVAAGVLQRIDRPLLLIRARDD